MPVALFPFDPAAALDFAALLGRPGQPLLLRCFPPTSSSKEDKARLKARQPGWGDSAAIEQFQAEGRGLYAVINPGGDTKKSITAGIAHFAEYDEGTKDEQWQRVSNSSLPLPSFVVDGGGRSLHFYWRLSSPQLDLDAWVDGQKRIAAVLNSDPSVSDPSRVMRLPGGWYIGPDLQPIARTSIAWRSDAVYTTDELITPLPQLQSKLPPAPAPSAPMRLVPDLKGILSEQQQQEALDQLQRIPSRTPGSNTRPEYLRLLWSLAALFGPEQAGSLMSSHSPAWAAEEDLTDKAREAKGEINPNTFFYVAKHDFGITGSFRITVRDASSLKYLNRLISPQSPDAQAFDDQADTTAPLKIQSAISEEAHRIHCLPLNDPTRSAAIASLLRAFAEHVHITPDGQLLVPAFIDSITPDLIGRAEAKRAIKERRLELQQEQHAAAKQRRLEAIRAKATATPDPILQLIAALPAPPDSSVNAGEMHLALIPAGANLKLRFNLMFRAIEMGGAEIPTHAVELAHVKFQSAGWKVSAADTYSALIATAREDSYHPVMEYLDRVEHDATITAVDLDTIADTYLGTTEPLYNQMLKVALIGAVRRIRRPACQHDTVLVFQGMQGCGKTNFWKALAGGQWYATCSSGKEVDMLMAMHRAWIVEMAELEGITSRHDISALRTLVTTTTDGFRPPYGRTTEMNSRRFLLVATVNPAGFLNDPEGFRRWHCIQLPHQEGQFIDVARVAADRDAIWKSAAAAERTNGLSHLPPELQIRSNATNQAEHVVETAWDAPIAAWAADQVVGFPFSVAQVLVAAGVREQTHIQPQDYGRVAQILKTLGWVKHPSKSRKAWIRQR